MATRYITRSLLATTKQSLAFGAAHSGTAAVIPNGSSLLFRLRPLVAAASASHFRRFAPAFSSRGFATRQTTNSLSDPNPNWSNRPPKETILLDGCDFEHWLVVMEKPEGDPTRDEIIESYINTLAMVIGSPEEARMKIYSVSTRHYYAFGALVSEELSYKLKELPRVRWVLPDSYLDVKNKDYGGEPFINGQAVPYDPKYHEEWVRNNARANERNRRNDRPRNFDRSRNFERRREMNNPGGGQPNMVPPPNAPNPGAMQQQQQQPPPNYAPNNPGGNYPPNNNTRGTANHQFGPNSGGGPSNYQPGPGPNQGNYPPPNYQPGPGPNQGNYPPPNYQSGPGPNQVNYPPPNYQPGPGPNQGNYPPPNYQPGPGPNQGNYPPPNYQPGPNAYAPSSSPPQNQNVSGRDNY